MLHCVCWCSHQKLIKPNIYSPDPRWVPWDPCLLITKIEHSYSLWSILYICVCACVLWLAHMTIWHSVIVCQHDDVIKWKHFPRYWPFVRGIHRSPVNSPHKGQWGGALMFSLICVWINDWVNNSEAGDLRRYCAHYDVIVMNNFIRHNGNCYHAVTMQIHVGVVTCITPLMLTADPGAIIYFYDFLTVITDMSRDWMDSYSVFILILTLETNIMSDYMQTYSLLGFSDDLYLPYWNVMHECCNSISWVLQHCDLICTYMLWYVWSFLIPDISSCYMP